MYMKSLLIVTLVYTSGVFQSSADEYRKVGVRPVDKVLELIGVGGGDKPEESMTPVEGGGSGQTAEVTQHPVTGGAVPNEPSSYVKRTSSCCACQMEEYCGV